MITSLQIYCNYRKLSEIIFGSKYEQFVSLFDKREILNIQMIIILPIIPTEWMYIPNVCISLNYFNIKQQRIQNRLHDTNFNEFENIEKGDFYRNAKLTKSISSNQIIIFQMNSNPYTNKYKTYHVLNESFYSNANRLNSDILTKLQLKR